MGDVPAHGLCFGPSGSLQPICFVQVVAGADVAVGSLILTKHENPPFDHVGLFLIGFKKSPLKPCAVPLDSCQRVLDMNDTSGSGAILNS